MAAFALLVFMAPAMVGWGQTSSIEINTTNSGVTGSYQDKEFDVDDITFKFTQWMKNTNIQAKKSTTNSLYNIDAIPGTITSIVFVQTGTARAITVYGGTSQKPTNQITSPTTGTTMTFDFSGHDYNYFSMTTPSNACYFNSITINYIPSGGNTPSMSVSTNSIDFGSENTINPANPYTETFNVTFDNLTENLSVSVGSGLTGVSVNPTSIATNATSPQTVTVSYYPTVAGSISGNISVNSSEVNEQTVAVTGSAYDPSNIDTYERYTGALVEGDYIICANAEVAMKNVISSSRFANQAVTVSDNKITNPDASIIWHIAPDGDYYTMYNAAVGKYAAGTTSNNQGALIDAVTDYARWNITYQYSNYTVICYGRNSSSNKYLRRNGDYGWGTYANSTGNVPTFYKKVVSNQVAMPEFSLAAGTYYETKSVTLSCATDGATIYYTTDGTTPSASNGTAYTSAISVSETMTIKAIAIKSGMTDSDVATATYTIELPLSTMNQIFAAATEAGNNAATVRIALGNWVVTGANSSSHAFVSDGTNGFMIYASGHGFSAGDVLSGTVECNVQLYNGAAEITQLTSSTTGLTVTTGGTVTVSNTAMADLAGINTGALVSYQNLTCEARVEGNYTNYYLSDGTTEIQAYKTLLDNYADYLEDGKIYNITGVFVLNNSTKRINPRSADDIEEVEVQHEEYTLTVSNLSHVDLFIFGGEESETIISTEDGETTAQVYDGTEVLVSIDVELGYVFQSLTITDSNGNPVEMVELTANEYYSFVMPASNVTITATAEVLTGDNYELYSGALVEGDYLIVYDGSAMNNTVTSSRLQYESVTVTNDVIITDNAAIVWHIAPSGDYWTIYNAAANKFAASTGAANKAQLLAGGTDDKALWTVTGDETYEFVNKQNTTNEVNANLRKNGTYGFACYSTQTGGALSLYKKVVATESHTLTITGYGTSTGGYYLIASPVTVDPATVDGMTEGDYDLYYFDQAEEKEWQNYKDTDGTGYFNLVPGKGYLYAHKTGGQFTLTGTPYSGDGKVTLNKTNDTNADFPGWNLVGNPFDTTAYIDIVSEERPFYTMNGDGNAFEACTNTSIDAKEGIFVVAEEDGEIMTFTTTQPTQNGKGLVLNLSDGRKAIDRAIVRFNKGRQLPKLQFRKGSTMVYIPVEGKDYAVVRAEEMGEMPVNFKAENNGSYNLSLSSENVEFAYLHLIDNMTGADIDLLQTPSYSFEAKTTDYANRFKLVYATGDNSNDDNFAFYSNGSFVINNDGNATLQVVDVTGRIIKCESINGCANVKVNAAPGVYMLRLVNGDNMKIQKVVVK